MSTRSTRSSTLRKSVVSRSAASPYVDRARASAVSLTSASQYRSRIPISCQARRWFHPKAPSPICSTLGL